MNLLITFIKYASFMNCMKPRWLNLWIGFLDASAKKRFKK